MSSCTYWRWVIIASLAKRLWHPKITTQSESYLQQSERDYEQS